MKSILVASVFVRAALAANKGINPNPNPNFDPATNPGNLGPFTAVRQASPAATGAPAAVDPRTAQAMQLAMSNWMTDTGIVSGFQNIGQQTNDDTTFRQIADGAFKAEVDELSQKAVLDAVIGNDPRVSIANLTLTNGVFQSVVDNLQIMSFQGKNKQNLIDAINRVRCVQILPSIDTYMIVAAEKIGANAEQRRAVRPLACANILAASQNNVNAFPNVPGTPGGNPAGLGDGKIPGVPDLGQYGGGSLGSQAVISNNGNAANAANSPLSTVTTPQLGLPGFPNNANTNNANANTGATTNANTNVNTNANTNANTNTNSNNRQGDRGQNKGNTQRKGATDGANGVNKAAPVSNTRAAAKPTAGVNSTRKANVNGVNKAVAADNSGVAATSAAATETAASVPTKKTASSRQRKQRVDTTACGDAQNNAKRAVYVRY